MNRRSIFTLSTIAALGLALLPSSIVAQQESLKQQLVGTWTLVSLEVTAPHGTKRQPPGANPEGTKMFDAGGRYVVVQGRPDRSKFRNPFQPTTEETAIALQVFVANFGTWSVSEADKTLIQHVDGALVPNIEGTDVKASVSLAGDELKLSEVIGGLKADSVYRRAR